MSAEKDQGITTLLVADADALRVHLDALNESGTDYRAAGMGKNGEPFLIALSGPYAESEDVIYGSPWDGEVDYGTGVRCDECNAAHHHGIGAIAFPAVVLIRPGSEPDRG